MNVEKYLEPRIAPLAVFDALQERKDWTRFVLPDGSTITYGQFAEAIAEIGTFLKRSGIRAEDRCAIFAPNRWEWAAAALGIQAAGGCVVPVYPACTSEQAAYVIDHCDARVLFVDTRALLSRVIEALDRMPKLERIVYLGSDAVSHSKLITLEAARQGMDTREVFRAIDEISLDGIGLMLYTSGTTGNPKGVPLTHRNVSANGADWLECNAPLIEEKMVDLLWLPMSHIFGFGEMCLGNTLGWTSYLADPVTVLDRLPQVKPHVFFSVPSHWEKIAKAGDLEKSTGGRLRFCLSGGAGLKQTIKEQFHAAGILVLEGYGLTEASPTLTLNRPCGFRFDSVGKALPHVELKLAEDGEILARGPNIFRGYHKDAEASKTVLTDDGWLMTGDVGRFTEDGFLQIIDRKKDILVTAGGKNVPPANIEMKFAGDPNVGAIVVYGEGKKYLVAGIWSAASREEIQKSVDRVNKELASYETIKKFAVMKQPLTVENGLLTASFKVRRKKIYETFRADFEALYAE